MGHPRRTRLGELHASIFVASGRPAHAPKEQPCPSALAAWLGARLAVRPWAEHDRVHNMSAVNIAHPGRGTHSTGHESAVDVLLVCSAGGHLMQLRLLRDAWERHGLRTAWVTLDREDARTLLAQEDVTFAYGPTTRDARNLLRNTRLAWRILRARRPRVILSTGAGIAVPFAWIGRLRGVPTVYVESLTRIDLPSLSCRLISPIAARLYCQWPELARRRRRMRYVGRVIGRA